ncbi:hypothetical protein TNCV_2046541 [Trichonephila clavipes]|uniref:Uncharacterized protein n=1 Tax=Trichonephila clavipes TaxID=2585209 RepID=A0A8X6VQR8_TRICX|nr:hypothetical protein TNCV_2046541 [Trichonephila clavipes]
MLAIQPSQELSVTSRKMVSRQTLYRRLAENRKPVVRVPFPQFCKRDHRHSTYLGWNKIGVMSSSGTNYDSAHKVNVDELLSGEDLGNAIILQQNREINPSGYTGILI